MFGLDGGTDSMCVSAAVAVLGVCVDYLADADRRFGRVRRAKDAMMGHYSAR